VAALGRAELTDELAGLIEAGHSVVLVGEAGIGKTTVLRAALDAGQRPVFEGGALATLSWMECLCLRRALGRELVGGDAEALAFDVVDTVADGVLALEDLHWADSSTLEVVTLVAGKIPVLATVRTGHQQTEPTLDLLRAAGFSELVVEPLADEVARRVIRSVQPDVDAASEAMITRQAGGNPLLLTELAAHREPPASLRLALGARLRALDQLSRTAFEQLALAGRPLPRALLGADAVEGLQRADLVQSLDGLVAPRHALLAETAVDLMDAEARRAAHATLAGLITDPGEASRHHELAGDLEPARAKALQAAAEATAANRSVEAATHLGLAARLSSGDAADALRLQAAQALESIHDWQAAGELLDCIEGNDPQIRARAALLRVRGAWVAGRPELVRSALAEGLALAAGTGSDLEVRLRVEEARVPIFIDCDLDRGVATATTAWELACAAGVAVDRAEYFLGTALSIADRPLAREHLTAAIHAARASGDPETELSAAHNLISFHQSCGSVADAQALARAMHERATELGLGHWQTSFLITAAQLDFHLGAIAACLDTTGQLLTVPTDRRARDLLAEVRAMSLIDLGHPDAAARVAAEQMAAAVDDYRGHGQLVWVSAEAALWGGHPRRALQLLDDYLAGPPGDRNRIFGHVTRAWAAFEAGGEPVPPGPPQVKPILRAIPHEIEGVALLPGNPYAAAAAFATAAALWAPYHRRGELRCLWAHGEALRRADDRTHAIVRLEAVEQRASELGHLMILGRIRRSLRALGVRRTAARTVDPTGLTGREREVLGMVGAGLTNAQIAARLGISRNTVVSLIGSATVRLGASSRMHAALLVEH
jgi:DNA-binding CsgD family transcriptional regulator